MEPLDKFIIDNVSTHKKRYIESSGSIICLYPTHFTWEEDSIVEKNPTQIPEYTFVDTTNEPQEDNPQSLYIPSQETNIEDDPNYKSSLR